MKRPPVRRISSGTAPECLKQKRPSPGRFCFLEQNIANGN